MISSLRVMCWKNKLQGLEMSYFYVLQGTGQRLINATYLISGDVKFQRAQTWLIEPDNICWQWKRKSSDRPKDKIWRYWSIYLYMAQNYLRCLYTWLRIISDIFIHGSELSLISLYPCKQSLWGVYCNQPVGRLVGRAVGQSVCLQNLVRTTPPTVSVQFTWYLAEVFIRSCRCARHTFCKILLSYCLWFDFKMLVRTTPLTVSVRFT